MLNNKLKLIRAPILIPGVQAITSTRDGGVSEFPFHSLNLGEDVGDDLQKVLQNRNLLQEELPGDQISWIKQVHGEIVVRGCPSDFPEADAQWTSDRKLPLAILTADCLPLVVADNTGSYVGVAHAGWRGLASELLQSLIFELPVKPNALSVWLGPAIGPSCYEIGEDVRSTIINSVGSDVSPAFNLVSPGKWQADLYLVARCILTKLGVSSITGGNWCTASHSNLFFSHRRDSARTGRMATVIWLD